MPAFGGGVADDNYPPGHVFDKGDGDVELGPEIPDGSPGPLDGERLCTVGILGPQLRALFLIQQRNALPFL